MSREHPVVWRFRDVEHHLTFKEAAGIAHTLTDAIDRATASVRTENSSAVQPDVGAPPPDARGPATADGPLIPRPSEAQVTTVDCRFCSGSGRVEQGTDGRGGWPIFEECEACDGKGKVAQRTPEARILDVERWRKWLWVRLDSVTTHDHISEIAEELAFEVHEPAQVKAATPNLTSGAGNASEPSHRSGQATVERDAEVAELRSLSPLDRAHAFVHRFRRGLYTSPEDAIQLLSKLLPYEPCPTKAGNAPRWTVSAYLTRGDRVLLVHHKKLDMWLPVGGGIEAGERPAEAVLREVREETGFAITEIDCLGFDEHWTGERIHMNLAHRARVLSSGDPESDGSWFGFTWLRIGDEPPKGTPKNVREALLRLGAGTDYPRLDVWAERWLVLFNGWACADEDSNEETEAEVALWALRDQYEAHRTTRQRSETATPGKQGHE